ncbi:hypothetical protein [Acinetobacter baumannii]|nr:hypothetical protein [Acinetobacter baumannii]
MQEIKSLLEQLNQLEPLPAKNRETYLESLTRRGALLHKDLKYKAP